MNWPKQQYNKLKRRKMHFLLGSFYGIYNRKAFWKVKIIFMNCFYFLFFMNNGKFLNCYIFHTDLISKICADYFLQSQSKNNIKSSKACSVIRLSLLNRNCYMFYLFVLLFIEKNTWKITNTIVYYQLLASITIFQIFFLIFHDGKFILWTKPKSAKATKYFVRRN